MNKIVYTFLILFAFFMMQNVFDKNYSGSVISFPYALAEDNEQDEVREVEDQANEEKNNSVIGSENEVEATKIIEPKIEANKKDEKVLPALINNSKSAPLPPTKERAISQPVEAKGVVSEEVEVETPIVSTPELSPIKATESPSIINQLIPFEKSGKMKISSLPWYIARAAGITSFILMFLIIVLGEGMTTSFIYSIISPVKAWLIHKYLGIVLGLTVIVHLVSLLFDNYVNIKIVDIFLPFFSDFKPLYMIYGRIAFYLLLIVILSSLFIRNKLPFLWRNIHYFVYPIFAFASLHGFFIGTDSSTPVMRMLYAVTGLTFLILLFYRVVIYRARFAHEK